MDIETKIWNILETYGKSINPDGWETPELEEAFTQLLTIALRE